MSVTIFGPDGSKRVLTGQEAEDWRKAHEPSMEEKLAITQQWLLQLEAQKNVKRFAKRMNKRGYIQPRTRSSYGWRMRERPSSALRFEVLNPAIPNIDWDHAAPGEGTMWRYSPRTKVGHTEQITVWAAQQNNRESRRQLDTPRAFYAACDDAKCKKHTCARCWAVEHACVGANEVVVFQSAAIQHVKVRDPSGVTTSGNRPQGGLVPAEDERSTYGLVSTQGEYKKGSGSKWR